MRTTATKPLGVFTGELHRNGYGLHPVIRFDRPLPELVNGGYNNWSAIGLDSCQIESELPPELGDLHRYTAPELRADLEWRGWSGWIQARFTNGETPLFIAPHSDSYDKVLKRYTGNIYSVQG